MERSKQKDILIIATLFLAALIIRLYTINLNPIWVDEGVTYIFTTHSFTDIWNATTSGLETNPPLFYWMEKIVVGLMGVSRFSLRILPVIAGALTVPVIYFLGKEIDGWKTGIIAALLLTFSPWHIAYSQEARAYILAMLFLVIALYFSSKKKWMLFSLFAALAIWTHFYTALFVLPVFLFDTLSGLRWKDIFPLFFVTPLLVALPGLLSTRFSTSTGHGTTGLDLILQVLYQNGGLSQIAAIIFITMIIYGIYRIYSNITSICLWTTVFVIPISLILANYINIVPKYLSYLLPLWVLAAAASFDKRRPFLTSIPLLLYAIMLIFPLISILTIPYKEDWKGIIDFAIAFNTTGIWQNI